MDDLVFDCEANGLLDTVSEVHCICGVPLLTTDKISLYQSSLNSKNVEDLFMSYNKIIGHNIIGYDIPLIKMFYGIDLIKLKGIENIVDTYIISQVLHPDRQLPNGCPTSLLNPVTRTIKKIGPHGLEAWGYRVGFKKIEIHDWRYFDEKMLERCLGDIDINKAVYFELMKEAGINGRTI